jgi:hypothetical protein
MKDHRVAAEKARAAVTAFLNRTSTKTAKAA